MNIWSPKLIYPPQLTTPQHDCLTVYSAGPTALIRKQVTAFRRQTGLEVELFQSTTGKVLARLDAESLSPSADLVITASWDVATNMEHQGLLAPLTAPLVQTLPSRWRTTCLATQALSALTIVWSRESGTAEPRDWSDLALPAFRDGVVFPDPTWSGATADLVMGLWEQHGEKFWELVSRMVDNGMILAPSNDHALALLLRGEKMAVCGGVDYMAYGHISRGVPIKVIFPDSGTVVAQRAMMILASSTHQQQANAFIEFMLGSEAQQIIAHTGLMRVDETNPHVAKPTRELLLSAATAQHRDEVLARFLSMFPSPALT